MIQTGTSLQMLQHEEIAQATFQTTHAINNVHYRVFFSLHSVVKSVTAEDSATASDYGQ